jgi:hypothetical protein
MFPWTDGYVLFHFGSVDFSESVVEERHCQMKQNVPFDFPKELCCSIWTIQIRLVLKLTQHVDNPDLIRNISNGSFPHIRNTILEIE